MNPADEHRMIWDFAMKVNEYCPGNLGWIAKQNVSERQPYDDLWGFVIGKGFASVRASEAVNADDTLVRQAATDIMGYAPESLEDWQWRANRAREELDEIAGKLTELKKWETHWAKKRGEALLALGKLQQEPSP